MVALLQRVKASLSRLGTSWLLVGCGAAPVPAPPAIVMPIAARPPGPVSTCQASDEPATERHRVFDFMEQPLSAVRNATPNVRERSHTGLPRGAGQVGMLLRDRIAGMEACWKFASARGSITSALRVQLVIDPQGRAQSVVVGPSRTELGDCIAEQLDGAVVPLAAVRPTRVAIPIELRRSNQPAWPKPPPRPARGKQLASQACGFVATDGSIDELALAVPVVLSDYDAAREPRPTPTVRIGCTVHGTTLDKVEHKAAIMANRGAFETCYAVAHELDPALTGTTSIHVTFGASGQVIAASTDGAGDERFHHCMTRAAKALWIGPQDARVTVHFPFVLQGPAAPVDAVAKLAELRALGTCEALVEAVQLAVRDVAPWLDDDRVRGTIRELVARAKAMPIALARACLAPATDALDRFMRPSRSPWLWSSLDRHELLAPIFDRVDFGTLARISYAHELAPTRRADAIAVLDKLAADALLDPPLRAEYLAMRDGVLGQELGRCGLTGL